MVTVLQFMAKYHFFNSEVYLHQTTHLNKICIFINFYVLIKFSFCTSVTYLPVLHILLVLVWICVRTLKQWSQAILSLFPLSLPSVCQNYSFDIFHIHALNMSKPANYSIICSSSNCLFCFYYLYYYLSFPFFIFQQLFSEYPFIAVIIFSGFDS